ncbi:glycosyltransferase, partial [bacterium]
FEAATRFSSINWKHSALEISKRLWPDGGHDLLHAHDWHAALSVLYARLDHTFRMHPSVFTSHNLAHQGLFGQDALTTFGLPEHWFVGTLLEHRGGVNLVKGAIALADRVTAVSPRYASEIVTPEGGFGLHAHLAYHRDKLRGIVNGIDTLAYDPRTDAALPQAYGASSSGEGKATARQALGAALGLDPDDGPLFGVVSRLDAQKGLDVFFRVVPELVAWGAQVALLGQGDPALEAAARELAARYPGRVGVRIQFDDTIARRIYAGSTFVVVPSRFEPCGLSQLYAMRYGSMPIVSRTGGLLDTVAPLAVGDLEQDAPVTSDRRGPGFLVEPGSELELLEACVRACELAADGFRLQRVRERLMARDFSWARSAAEMAELYATIRP